MGSTVYAMVSTPGATGPPGPTGYSPKYIVAAGVPASGTGNVGDMYINSSTGDVYGPKTSGGWGAVACNIRGPAGAPGATGATGYSPQYIVAAGVPGAGVGNNGDMYINSTTSDVYGPKTSGAWGGIVCNIKGAAGAAGPPGVGYNPRGAWVPGTPYAQGDQVSSGGALYISLSSGNTGNNPATSPTFWEPVAATAAGSQTPWLQNIDAATFELHNTAKIGIATSAPAYPLDVVGDVNITGVYRVGGVPISAGSQTPWTADINAANHALYSASRVTIGNDGSVEPAGPATTEILIGSTASGGSTGRAVMLGNASTQGSTIGQIAFANYAISVAEKRIATMSALVGGAINSAYVSFYVSATGSLTEILRLEPAQATIFGASSANLIFSAGNINAPNTALALQTGGASRITILASGFVGIGNTSPSYPLQVVAASGNPAVYFGNANVGMIFCSAAGNTINSPSWPLLLQTNAISRIVIALGGNVGISQGTPNYALDVTGDVNCTGNFRLNGTPIAGVTTQVNPVRGAGTVYQNTFGRPLFVTMSATCVSGSAVQAKSDSSSSPSTIVAAASNVGASSAVLSITFWVLPNNYFVVTAPSGISYWTEWY